MRYMRLLTYFIIVFFSLFDSSRFQFTVIFNIFHTVPHWPSHTTATAITAAPTHSPTTVSAAISDAVPARPTTATNLSDTNKQSNATNRHPATSPPTITTTSLATRPTVPSFAHHTERGGQLYRRHCVGSDAFTCPRAVDHITN